MVEIKRSVILSLIAFLVIGFLIFNILNDWYIEFDLIEDKVIEYTDDVVLSKPKAYLKGKYVLKDGIEVKVNTTHNIEEGKVGEYLVNYSASFLFLKNEVKGNFSISDSEYPSIELDFFHNTYILPGEDYNNFVAMDNYDGDLTNKVEVDVQGENIVYSVKDTYGNETSVIRKLVTDNTKIIYLTFDDGPSKYTSELLDILKKHNVKATFFVIGSLYSDIFPRMVEEGHAIGIHTYTHEFKDIYRNEDAYFMDLGRVRDLINRETGYETKLLRFPGGSSNTASKNYNVGIMTRLVDLVEERGYQYFDWNVDSGDSGGTTDTEQVYENVKNGVAGKRIAVVLQHDTKKFSIDAVEKIIIWGKLNDYVFLPLNEYSFAAHHRVLN